MQVARERGFDAIVYEHSQSVVRAAKFTLWHRFTRLFHIPVLVEYSKYAREALAFFRSNPDLIPCILPNYDHSPRSKNRGTILINNDPRKWYKYCREVKKIVESRDKEPLVFIQAWNEWGEGNYLEPDLKFGKSYIEKTRMAFNQ